MLGAARAYAEANQAVMMTPFILAGAMSPATVAACCAQTLAEVAGGHGVRAARPPGRPGRARLVRIVDVDAVGGADLRHTRAGARALRDGRRSRGGWACRSARAARSRRRRSPTRRPPTSRRTRCSRRCSAASTSSSTPPAGSRAAWRWATRSSCSTPTSSACGTRSCRASTCPRTARRWTRS